MKGGIAILVTFLICLVVVVIYFFVGKSQMNKTTATLDQEIAELDTQIADIRQKEGEITHLVRQLPVWRRQSQLFKKSIPAQVDDHVFFAALAGELERNPGVELINMESVFGGAWLGEVKEDEQEKLAAMGIDPEVAAGIRVVFYSINLMGGFDEVLNVFENLKKSQRLYTIDLIAGPAVGGSGTISVNSQQEATPIQFSGRLYYNLPDPALSTSGLEAMFFEALTMHIHRHITEAGEAAIEEVPAPVGESDGPAGEQAPESTDNEPIAAPEPEPGPQWQETEEAEEAEEPVEATDQIALVVAGASGSTIKEGR